MFNFLNFIKYIFAEKHFTGVLPDNRSDAEKQLDWNHEERVSSPVINYVTKEVADTQKKYVVYNQYQTSSCVAHATTTEISILMLNTFKKVFKGMALFIYRLRSNYSGEGMIGNNSSDIAIKNGVPTFVSDPTTEAAANAMVITPEMYTDAANQKPTGYFSFKNISFDAIAAQVSQGTAVKIFIKATVREWAKEFVSVMDPTASNMPIAHAIVILPNTVFQQNGEDYVLIQDSAWFGGLFYRYVPRSFFDANRCFYSSYFLGINYADPAVTPKPKYTFTKTLKYGMTSPDVKALQEILIYEGLMPTGFNTGFFGGLSLAGVNKYQLKYKSEILAPAGLTQPTGVVAKYTIAKLNRDYA